MRYPPEHKSKVHQKIIQDASRRVRNEGLNGAAVATIMRDTGLTHGGFYKHFASKQELLLESLHEAFREIGDTLVAAAQQAPPGEGWRAIVKTYLSLEYCDHVDRGCPLPALAPELARVDRSMRGPVVGELVSYRDRLLPFMPGARPAERERNFYAIISTMMGAVELARILPHPEAQEKVLASARDFLLQSF